MIKAEFGIIDHFEGSDYVVDESISLVYIDDDIYIDAWWNKLQTIKTYVQNLDQPALALDRWGITIIPPSSLPAFQEIVLSDQRIQKDDHLIELADLISLAISQNKFMIHYGV